MFCQAASHLLRHPFGRASYTEGTNTGGEIFSMLNIFLHPCFDIEFNHVFITRHGWNICAVTFCTYCPPPQKMIGGTDEEYKGLLNLSDCIDFCQVPISDQRQKMKVCKLSAKYLTSLLKFSFIYSFRAIGFIFVIYVISLHLSICLSSIQLCCLLHLPSFVSLLDVITSASTGPVCQ